MISENQIGLAENPWGVLAPVILLGIFAVGTNLFCDAAARVSIGDRVIESATPGVPAPVTSVTSV
jgi:peptide/nickel transport system permease protein